MRYILSLSQVQMSDKSGHKSLLKSTVKWYLSKCSFLYWLKEKKEKMCGRHNFRDLTSERGLMWEMDPVILPEAVLSFL